jgi:predicted nuclease of restriction endonuclease-like (RecB) superfamily
MKLVDNAEYKNWLGSIKSKFQRSQIQASISVNRELLKFYWELGKEISEKEKQYRWGSKFLQELSNDLQKLFPEVKGFSKRNLELIRKWYLFWSSSEITKQVVSQLHSIPWGHNIVIIQKSNSLNEAIYYVENTAKNNWSRNTLLHQMKSKLYDREGSAVTNFEITLPKENSDLAMETLKDPYIFDFLSLTKNFNEKELEKSLIDNIAKFLLELGKGFAFIGSQYHLEVSGKDYYLDLLFYHVKLRCYVVIELKIGEFKPEYAGKVNFYLSLVDDKLKSDLDNPSIGIILCTEKDRIIAEYSLRDMTKPIGVSEYQVVEELPYKFKDSLPTPQELQDKLESMKTGE